MFHDFYRGHNTSISKCCAKLSGDFEEKLKYCYFCRHGLKKYERIRQKGI